MDQPSESSEPHERGGSGGSDGESSGDRFPGDDPPEDKKRKVLNAALEEFVSKGYAGASTNVIAKEAGVAKGLVFHYFKSKKALFLAVFDYCVETQTTFFFNRVRRPFSPDIIQRVTEWGALKVQIVRQFPMINQFLLRAYLETPKDARDDIQKRIQAFSTKVWELFFEGIDYSLLRDDVEKEKVIRMLMASMEGLQQYYSNRYRSDPLALIRDADQVFSEFAEYMNMLKYGVYKRPEPKSESPGSPKSEST